MKISCFVAVWLLQCAGAVPAVVDTIGPIEKQELVARQSVQDLRPQLSDGAKIISPFDPEWTSLLARASYPRIHPSYNIIVEVATETDVQKTVSYANNRHIPFLAVAGAHGWSTSLNKLKGGIQINLRKLNSTVVDEGGKTATVGGGALQWEATKALYDAGKQTVTGLCECVSVIGPLMGGGHSYLQNQYGYALDNIESARVVLANGKLVETSSQKNPDLFWALCGAGHNFGIVTSFQMKLYDVPSSNQWTIYNFLFKQDKLEDVYTLVNTFENPKIRPPKLVLSGTFTKAPELDSQKPIVVYSVSYEGTQAEAEKYATPFKALGPLSTTVSTNVKYGDLYTVIGAGRDSPVCLKNLNLAGAAVGLPAWDIPGLRKAYELFSNATADPRFNTSHALLENYGMLGVQKVDPRSTALSPEERALPILTSAILWYEGDDANTHEDARRYVTAIRDALYQGVDAKRQKRHAYVNYANGDESVQEVYGYEEWRLGKLRALKRKYDPKNAFRYYVPIV